MVESRAASRYAKALLELAQEQNVLEQVHEDMLFFARTVEENRGLLLMLQSPVVPHFKKYTILKEIFQSRVHPTTFSIFEIITNKNREKILYDIAKSFHELYNAFNNIQVAQVVTTFPLDEQQRSQFRKITEEVTGKKIELQEKIDPALIGGFVLRIGDRQVDESIKGKLQKLQYDFIHS
jgi:F-type H+-transporting ATPase subunit delta